MQGKERNAIFPQPIFLPPGRNYNDPGDVALAQRQLEAAAAMLSIRDDRIRRGEDVTPLHSRNVSLEQLSIPGSRPRAVSKLSPLSPLLGPMFERLPALPSPELGDPPHSPRRRSRPAPASAVQRLSADATVFFSAVVSVEESRTWCHM